MVRKNDERYKRRMTEREVLKLFKDELYFCDIDTGIVTNKHGKNITPVYKNGYSFVHFFNVDCHRCIAVHRVVWMVSRKAVIPKGWHIHHDDEDTTNNSFENLICLYPFDHELVHGKRMYNHETDDLPF